MTRFGYALLAALLVAPSSACRTPSPGAAAGAPAAGALPPGRVVRIAHRGASGNAPENTIPAFDLAVRLGADYIELDIALTRDGVPVILHDPTLDRTTGGSGGQCRGPVNERTLAELRGGEAGGWFNAEFPGAARAEYAGTPLPTLEEVFRRYGHRTRYLVEIKQPQNVPGIEERLVELLERYDLRGRAVADRRQVIVQSFSSESVRKVHALAPELPLVQLLRAAETPASIVPQLDAIREYAIGIGPAKNTVDRAVVEAAHARGLHVFPYTVNETEEMSALLALGVDGIITNYPDRLESVLRGTGR